MSPFSSRCEFAQLISSGYVSFLEKQLKATDSTPADKLTIHTAYYQTKPDPQTAAAARGELPFHTPHDTTDHMLGGNNVNKAPQLNMGLRESIKGAREQHILTSKSNPGLMVPTLALCGTLDARLAGTGASTTPRLFRLSSTLSDSQVDASGYGKTQDPVKSSASVAPWRTVLVAEVDAARVGDAQTEQKQQALLSYRRRPTQAEGKPSQGR